MDLATCSKYLWDAVRCFFAEGDTAAEAWVRDRALAVLEGRGRLSRLPNSPEGWPIASGVIEGTCRYVVADRMDITGARWSVNEALRPDTRSETSQHHNHPPQPNPRTPHNRHNQSVTAPHQHPTRPQAGPESSTNARSEPATAPRAVL